MSLRWKIVLVYTHKVISTESNETIKKTISLMHGWIHARTCSCKQQMPNSWIFTVFSNMENPSFNFFVSFNINDWKESVESLNNSLIWEDTELYLLLSTHREWESFFVTSCKCCQQWLRLRWVLFICSALFLATTVFGNSCFPFFLHKLTFISRQNGLGRKTRVHKTVTKSPCFFL